MAQTEKRKVPPAIQKILEFDKELTDKFVLWANQIAPLRNLRIYYKGLEISCHGIPWFAFWLAFTWLFGDESLIPMQVNMLIGLFLDITFVAVAKAYFRRRRPMSNRDDALGQMGPDVFSFPSGHASRAVFAAFFFVNLYPLPIFWQILFLAWAIAVCISRILMNRHYIMDVLGGVVLGLITGVLLGLIWLEDSTAMWLMSYLSDEKLDGGEYHV